MWKVHHIIWDEISESQGPLEVRVGTHGSLIQIPERNDALLECA